MAYSIVPFKHVLYITNSSFLFLNGDDVNASFTSSSDTFASVKPTGEVEAKAEGHADIEIVVTGKPSLQTAAVVDVQA